MEVAVEDRMAEALLATNDKEITLDQRKLNGNLQSMKFNVFRLELATYQLELATYQCATHASCYFNSPYPQSNFWKAREEISWGKKPVPLLEWIRYKFWPKNLFSISALHRSFPG